MKLKLNELSQISAGMHIPGGGGALGKRTVIARERNDWCIYVFDGPELIHRSCYANEAIANYHRKLMHL